MRTLIALLAVVPLTALAQAPEPALAPAPASPAAVAPAPVAGALPEPEWSIGAGVAFDRILIASGGSAFLIDTGPELNASLERRLSPRTWLAFGARGSVYDHTEDVESGYGTPSVAYRRLAVMAGVRQLLTPGGAPVDVSLLALANAGVSAGDWTTEYAGTRERTEELAWGVGAELGIAVERELTGGIALRVATPIVGLGYAWADRDVGGQSLSARTFSADLTLAPQLELRVAF